MRISDWSSDVCSSDLNRPARNPRRRRADGQRRSRHGRTAAASVRFAQPARHDAGGGDARSPPHQPHFGREDDAARQGAAERPHRRAALPAAARRGMKLGILTRPADRRVLDDDRPTRAMRWILAVMLLLTVLAAALDRKYT